MTIGNWITIVGLTLTFLTSFAGAVFAFAVLRSRAESNAELIDKIEKGMTPREKEISEMQDKLNMIHIKLFGAYGNNGILSEVEEMKRAIRRLESKSRPE